MSRIGNSFSVKIVLHAHTITLNNTVLNYNNFLNFINEYNISLLLLEVQSFIKRRISVSVLKIMIILFEICIQKHFTSAKSALIVYMFIFSLELIIKLGQISNDKLFLLLEPLILANLRSI